MARNYWNLSVDEVAHPCNLVGVCELSDIAATRFALDEDSEAGDKEETGLVAELESRAACGRSR